MVRSILVAAILLAAPITQAQSIYKCDVAGKVTYSGTPCPAGKEQRVRTDGGPSEDDQARAKYRLQQQLSEQDDKDAIEAQAGAERQAARGAALQQGRSSPTADDGPRTAQHSKSGWDYKRPGQVEAEARARATGVAPTGNGAAWESEKSLSHSQQGWDRKTGTDQVRDVADRANQAKANAARAAARPSTLYDQYGRPYVNNGATALDTTNGRTCDVVGANLQNCR